MADDPSHISPDGAAPEPIQPPVTEPSQGEGADDERLSAAEAFYLAQKAPEDGEQAAKKRRPRQKAKKTDEDAAAATPATGGKLNIKRILGGDMFQSPWMRRQVNLLVLLGVLFLLYIGNRYASQQELIRIDELKKELNDAKYNALTRSGELLEMTRRSKIEEQLRLTGDSTLSVPAMSPYVIPSE